MDMIIFTRLMRRHSFCWTNPSINLEVSALSIYVFCWIFRFSNFHFVGMTPVMTQVSSFQVRDVIAMETRLTEEPTSQFNLEVTISRHPKAIFNKDYIMIIDRMYICIYNMVIKDRIYSGNSTSL